MVLIFIAMTAIITSVMFLNNTGGLLLIPAVSPEVFLSSVPHVPLTIFGKTLILIEPSSTILVYLLGLIMIGLGVFFLTTQQRSEARKYWGIGLVLWGIGALSAGTSYQAFGYELKCHNRELCQFTSNFELAYLLLTAYSINFLVAATGYTSLGEIGRKRLIRFAILDSLAYSIFMLVGVILPIRFLISYEGFIAFIGGNFVLMFILNIRYFLTHKDRLNLTLIWIWVGFLFANLGYFAALLIGFAPQLYTQYRIWFNENDTLHVLLILWACQVFLSLRIKMSDN